MKNVWMKVSCAHFVKCSYLHAHGQLLKISLPCNSNFVHKNFLKFWCVYN